ncbi:MAG TPA: hypothetical protein VJN88_08735 [Ktedonobacterales bacterium]|nr:hypothetical protein [Ktedonobacterales bacterium]
MLDLYRWQREQALASEQLERLNRHAYIMDNDEPAHEPHARERVAGALHALAFHLAPNTQWTRAAGKRAA